METATTTADKLDRQTPLDRGTAPQGGRDVTRVGKGRPGPGRIKGSQNRINRTIKEAVEIAARDCHPHGLAGWLVERAQGSLGDRQIFAGLVQKVIPAQLQAQVTHGGVVVQLGWLTQRNITNSITNPSQTRVLDAQVVDVTMEKGGDLRVTDTKHVQIEAESAPNENDSHPHPPINRQGGGGQE